MPNDAPYVPFPVVTVTLAEKPSLRMVGNRGEPLPVVFTPPPGPDSIDASMSQWVRENVKERLFGKL